MLMAVFSAIQFRHSPGGMPVKFAALIPSIALLLIFDAGTARPCVNNSQCNDSNPCTTDTCFFGSCSHINKANGTSCDLDASACTADYCLYGTCSAGGPPPEICVNAANEDCDSWTDEFSPSATFSTGCQGPRGVYETADWHKLKPTVSGDTFYGEDPGEVCSWSTDCYTRVCVQPMLATPGSHYSDAVCAYLDIGTAPATWDRAYVEEALCTRKVDYFYIPPIVGWTDPRSGASNNIQGESCQFNSDCQEGWCFRNGPIGKCGAYNYGSCAAGYVSVTADDFHDCPYCTLPRFLCMPESIACTSTAADNCSWHTGTPGYWTCP